MGTDWPIVIMLRRINPRKWVVERVINGVCEKYSMHSTLKDAREVFESWNK